MHVCCVIFLVLHFSVFLVNCNPPSREVRCDVEYNFIACNLQTFETKFLSASIRECSQSGELLTSNSYTSVISPFLLAALYNMTYPDAILITFLNCDLTKLDSDLFEHQLQLRQIWAPNEPFHCDCDMQWTAIVSHAFDWIITENCLTPSNLNGKPITDDSNYQNCVQPHSYQCFNRSFVCPANSTCVNTMDSAYCECNEGFFMFENKCHLNVDCVVNNGSCDHLCSTTNGTDHCVCLLGYRLYGDRRSCVDINECTEGLDTCEQACINTNGSYECGCDAGSRIGLAGSCYDIDECLSNNGGCDQICINTNGSYECECNAGSRLGLAGSCYDIDECLSNNGGCDQICTNTNGSYECECNAGSRLGLAGSCHGIDLVLLTSSITGGLVALALFALFLVLILICLIILCRKHFKSRPKFSTGRES